MIVAGSGEHPVNTRKYRGSKSEIVQIGRFKIHLGTFGDGAIANIPNGRNFLEVIAAVAFSVLHRSTLTRSHLALKGRRISLVMDLPLHAI